MPFKRRRGWRSGKWLIIDEESGVTRYNDEIRTDWRGIYVTKEYADSEHPQDFVKPLDDPKAINTINPPNRDFDICQTTNVLFVPNTTVPAKQNAASHLFDVGIGEAQIGRTFLVR